MKAIKEAGKKLFAAIDKHDAVGVIDSYDAMQQRNNVPLAVTDGSIIQSSVPDISDVVDEVIGYI